MNIMLSYYTNSLQSFSFIHIFTDVLYALVFSTVLILEHLNVIALYKLDIIIY